VHTCRAHINASDVPTENEIVTQVGITSLEHNYWGRPEQFTGERPTTTSRNATAADVFGGSAAVLAATSMILSKEGNYMVCVHEVLQHWDWQQN
jgi:hypothetical protein